MKKDRNSLEADMGTTLDECRWDYSPPKPKRRFFLKPLGAFFGNFPWEGGSKKPAPQSQDTSPEPRSR